jgi:hypothetical protein
MKQLKKAMSWALALLIIAGASFCAYCAAISPSKSSPIVIVR